MVHELCTELWKFMTDRFATHVARRVLCMLCGHDVLPPGSRGPQGGSGGGGGGGKASAGLAAKLPTKEKAAAGRHPQEGCRFPELLESLVSILTREDYGGASMEELLGSTYASPFIQGALKAASMLQGNRSLLATLIPSLLGTSYFYDAGNKNKVPSGAKLIEGVSADRVYAMCMDSTTSHVVEAVMGVAHAVPGLIDAMLQRFFKGRMQDMAFHQSANFVLQAALAATSTPAQVQPLYEELAPCIGDLLRCRRSGVVAALLAACGRANCCQKEACSVLAAAIASTPQSSGKTGKEALAPSLLCLDTAPSLGHNHALQGTSGSGESWLSALGSAILITVLRFSQMKQHLLARMGGAYSTMVLTGSGSFLLERCFDMAEGPTKEAIISEVLTHERDLEAKYWGPRLLKRLGAEAYKREPLQWRRHLESTAKTKVDFEKLFGNDFEDAPKSSKQEKKLRKQQQQQQQQQQQLEEGPGMKQATVLPEGAAAIRNGSQTEAAQGHSDEAGANRKKSKKKRKVKEEQGGPTECLHNDVAGAEKRDGEVERKKKKKTKRGD
ncbi:hypothetical protein DUNSADRAFT_3379 [Dunaliella salina]|uniref:Nucleolar protein 9 n=1 Tax=Dunaliella salina TaxID=3046 RepID=A0ABQ7GU72_DUNSA|nr:hypothetical protein DUNSADRAFT_3379 [Dunaliella salina]|eukprot:KAF5838129.1 hypothetical protein DUNSADRAFT_3379 [Dunaliella salina]